MSSSSSSNDNSDHDITFMKDYGGRPSEPFEVDIVRDAIRRRIQAGDITPNDVKVLQSSYKAVSYGSIGGAFLGIPLYIQLGKKRPQPPTSFRVMAGVTAALGGTILGFGVGSMIGAWKVKHDMTDSPRKLRVFSEIAYDSQRAISEIRAGIPTGAIVKHIAGVPGQDSFWTPQTGTVTYDQLRDMERKGEKWAQNVKQQWDQASEQTKKAWQDAADQAKDGWSQAKAQATDGWNQAKVNAQDAVNQAGSKWDEIKEQAKDQAAKEAQKGESLWNKWTK